jgi:hypothetical protein
VEELSTAEQQQDTSRHDATRRDTSRHTLTIKQAAQLFAAHGVPRSPRSVQRFCELGSIEAIRVKGEKTERYFIDPTSVERYAEELKQLESISQIGNDEARHDASQRDMTRHVATETKAPAMPDLPSEPDHETEQLRQRVNTLEKEKLQLQIDRAAKEQVIGHMVDERRGCLNSSPARGERSAASKCRFSSLRRQDRCRVMTRQMSWRFSRRPSTRRGGECLRRRQRRRRPLHL